VFTDNLDQDEAVIAVIVAFMREASQMAEITADYLYKLNSVTGFDDHEWHRAFLLELGAVLKIRQWEIAGINDAVDSSLPSFQDAFTELAERLRIQPESFIRGETPYACRVLMSWWRNCVHPNESFLPADLALSGDDRSHLLACVAQLLWKLRDLEIGSE
jgi:hypothetical protein